MKQIVTLTLLVCMAFVQAANNGKRPSWSQGLPEKKEVPELNKPELKVESVEIERPTFETESIHPKIMYSEELKSVEAQQENSAQELQTLIKETPTVSSNQSFDSDDVADQTNHSEIQTKAILKEPLDEVKTVKITTNIEQQSPQNDAENIASETETFINHDNKFYSWEITRQLPIKVSSRVLQKQQSVLLKIFINAKGSVIAVEPVLNDTPQSLVIQAERSIKRWRFVSPQSLGFKQQVLSRVFKVALSGNG